jgi:hypothetical protein
MEQNNYLNICKNRADSQFLYFQWVRSWRFRTEGKLIPTVGIKSNRCSHADPGTIYNQGTFKISKGTVKRQRRANSREFLPLCFDSSFRYQKDLPTASLGGGTKLPMTGPLQGLLN